MRFDLIDYAMAVSGAFIRVIAYAMLALPAILVIVSSFTSGDTMNFPPTGFSLRWYQRAWQNELFMAPVSTPTTSAAALEQTFGEIPSNVGDGYQIESVRISRIRNRDGDWSAMLKFSRCETFRKKETDMGIDKQPVLGIIQLDSAHAMEGASGDVIERSDLMPFSIGDPSLWHLPLQSVIAKRADIIANKVPTPEAVSGILEAVGRLDPHAWTN